MCSWVPRSLDLDAAECPVIWNGTRGSNTVGAQPDVDNTVVSSLGLNLPTSVITSSSSIVNPSSSIVTSSSSIVTSSRSDISSSTSSSTSTPIRTISRTPQTVTVFVSPQPTQIRGDAARKGAFGDDGDEDKDDEDDDEDKVCTAKSQASMSLIFLQFLIKRSGLQIMAFQEGGQNKVNISGMGFNNIPATLDTSCLWALNWPVSVCVLRVTLSYNF